MCSKDYRFLKMPRPDWQDGVRVDIPEQRAILQQHSLGRIGKRQPAEFLPPIVQNCSSRPSFIGSNPPWHAIVRVKPTHK